jgi:hypothetical protein
MAKTVKKVSGPTEKRSPARRSQQSYFAAAVRISSLRNCIKTHLNLTDQDLAKPIGDVFHGQANPVDVIISELGNSCYSFTPRQVYKKINNRPVRTVNDFIKYLGG